eukprot:6471701-Amphidinium_carterae.1
MRNCDALSVLQFQLLSPKYMSSTKQKHRSGFQNPEIHASCVLPKLFGTDGRYLAAKRGTQPSLPVCQRAVSTR